jgi:hypothetical protein
VWEVRHPSIFIRERLKPGVSASTTNSVIWPWGSSLGRRRRGDLRGDDGEVAPGAVGDEDLAAVEHPVVAVAAGPGGQRRDVAAGAGLGDRERADEPAGDRVGEVALLELLVAAPADVEHREVVVRAEVGGHAAGPERASSSIQTACARGSGPEPP